MSDSFNNIQPEEHTETQEATSEDNTLVLHNDDVNTFDHVIECLITICDHDLLQAEQCAMITHYNGECSIKKGPKEELEDMLLKLVNNNLTVSMN